MPGIPSWLVHLGCSGQRNAIISLIMRKPYYVKRLNCWYVTDSKSKRPVRLDPNEEEAYRKWEIWKQSQTKVIDQITFSGLVQAWKLEHDLQPGEGVKRHGKYIQQFAKFIEAKCGLSILANEISKTDFLSWLTEVKPQKKKPWAKTTQADAASAIKRLFRWAIDDGKLSRSPLAKLKTPVATSRVITVSQEEHALLVREAQRTNPPFALYLIASRCGARPRQIREVTFKNVLSLADNQMVWIFADHKTYEKTGKPLVVHCHPCLATITKILVSTKRKFLFVNRDGHQWKKDSVVRAMDRIRSRAKVNEAITVYAYRHSFATDALLAGLSLAVVAELLGHADTRMVGRVYGHLDQHKSHLIEAATRTAAKRLG